MWFFPPFRHFNWLFVSIFALWANIMAVPAWAQQTLEQGTPEQRVSFPNNDPDGPILIQARLFKPEGAGPFPAIIALHGCGGAERKGELSDLHKMWNEKFLAAGYVVLIPDSFGSRGLGSQCKVKERKVRPGRERARDTIAARNFLRSQAYVNPEAINMIGWSNGGSTVLWTGGRNTPPGMASAIALYPGCTSVLKTAKENKWSVKEPLLILIGDADNWTAAQPCRDLVAFSAAKGQKIDLVTYPGAFHSFDWPNMPIREMNGVAYSADGTGKVTLGTNPEARDDAVRQVIKFLRR